MTCELLTARDVAGVLKITTRQVFKLRSSGRMPAPVKVGRSTRWRASELAGWVEAGCPGRDEWERCGQRPCGETRRA